MSRSNRLPQRVRAMVAMAAWMRFLGQRKHDELLAALNAGYEVFIFQSQHQIEQSPYLRAEEKKKVLEQFLRCKRKFAIRVRKPSAVRAFPGHATVWYEEQERRNPGWRDY